MPSGASVDTAEESPWSKAAPFVGTDLPNALLRESRGLVGTWTGALCLIGRGKK